MKVRRITATLLALALLLVCLPMQARAEEQRDSLLSKRMEQVQAITIPEEGTYLFTTFEDLQSIADLARSNPKKTYAAVLFTDDQLVITEDLLIPENMVLDSYNGKFLVEAGANLTVEGIISAKRLIVFGTIHVKETGTVLINSNLMLSDQYGAGFMMLEGALYLNDGWDSNLLNADQITYGVAGVVVCSGTFENEEQLRAACAAAAENADPHWTYYLDDWSLRITLTEDLFIPANCVIEAGLVFGSEDEVTLTLAGVIVAESYFGVSYDTTILPSGGMFVGDNMFFERKLVNLGVIEIATGIDGYRGQLDFNGAELYTDSSPYGSGVIRVMTEAGKEFPAKALPDFDVNDFSVDWEQIDGASVWTLTDYHKHTVITDPAVAPTCLDYGRSESSYCLTCQEEFTKSEVLAPLGHSYTDPWDTTCNVCQAERLVDKSHLTYSMYRMYDPYSGEHFYTGSMEERQMLEANQWKYEGVGFTFPYSSGKPVYRLYDRNKTHEHLYTMDEAEKDALIAAGWEYEGIAFNSCPREEVPQYRLRNPNTTRGAYHFTASVEEKDMLIAAGWIYEGIGFYTCLQ